MNSNEAGVKINLKYLALTVALLMLVSYIGLTFKGTRSRYSGYINKTWVNFPVNSYTFLIGVDDKSGKPIIYDNLWGFKFPGFTPLTPDKRAEFMTAYHDTDWVRVSVHKRDTDPASCYDWTINDYSKKDEPGFHLFIWGSEEKKKAKRDIMERKPGHYYGTLKKMSVPQKNTYYDFDIYRGPVDIYWNEEKGHACTLITCKTFPNKLPGLQCQQINGVRVKLS